MKDKFVIIFVTCVSKEDAGKIIDSLLKKRLAACGNIVGGVESKFWWNGKIDSATEVLVMLKAKAANFKAIEKEVKRIHSYDVPEIIAIPIVDGSKEYLKWIGESAV
ncbi:MAG: divalent-cation tolerance protein CutA [Candidatus Omnitrophota bacterium]|nr:divalent-cation tolerance protein CutA [Candidatus Omnitrophota bacterium]